MNFTSPETRGIGNVLPDAENRTLVSSFVWTQYRSVSDGRTDRRIDGQTDGIPLLVQRSALRAMRTRSKNCTILFYFIFVITLSEQALF